MNSFTFTGLSVGVTYRLSVKAINDIGESIPGYLDLLAASVPQKLAVPTLVTSTVTSISI